MGRDCDICVPCPSCAWEEQCPHDHEYYHVGYCPDYTVPVQKEVTPSMRVTRLQITIAFNVTLNATLFRRSPPGNVSLLGVRMARRRGPEGGRSG